MYVAAACGVFICVRTSTSCCCSGVAFPPCVVWCVRREQREQVCMYTRTARKDRTAHAPITRGAPRSKREERRSRCYRAYLDDAAEVVDERLRHLRGAPRHEGPLRVFIDGLVRRFLGCGCVCGWVGEREWGEMAGPRIPALCVCMEKMGPNWEGAPLTDVDGLLPRALEAPGDARVDGQLHPALAHACIHTQGERKGGGWVER